MSAVTNITTDTRLLKEAGWEDFVRQHPDGNFFQLPQAYDLFSKVPGYTPIVIGAVQAGKVTGILLSVLQKENAVYGFLTARAIVWGGPLVQNAQTAEQLLSHYNVTLKNKAIYTQFRNLFDCTSLNDTLQHQRFRQLEHLNDLVDTKDRTADSLLSKSIKNTGRQIKDGLKTS